MKGASDVNFCSGRMSSPNDPTFAPLTSRISNRVMTLQLGLSVTGLVRSLICSSEFPSKEIQSFAVSDILPAHVLTAPPNYVQRADPMNSANSHGSSILRPYNGSHHILPDGCPKELSTFSGDTSSRVVYSFNSQGFRGEEFRITADAHIFVCGASVTLGLGLDYAHAWVSVFRHEFAKLNDLQEANVNLQNFSSSGCGNGYIARTLIGQCLRFRPTLALVELPFSQRAEMLHNGRSYNIGPWCLLDDFDNGAQADGHRPELRQMIRRKAKAYYELDDKLSATQDLLKNALLLQWFFQVHKIPFLIGLAAPDLGESVDDPLLAPWMESLDFERVFTISPDNYQIDESSVSGHPGPAGSQAIAEIFLSRYKDIYGLERHSIKEQGTPGGLQGTNQAQETSQPSHRSWKKWLGKKANDSESEDSTVYPLY